MAAKITRVHKYYFAKDGDVESATIEFFPIPKQPMLTHRVVVNGLARDWLSDTHNPNQKSALFFYQKHILGQK